jgi:hypothetical protein
MARKILTWGVVAGVVLFLWGAVSHMLLPLGKAGIRTLPEDKALLEFMAARMPERAIYFYPRLDLNARPEDMKEWEQRAASGPSGLIVHRPRGGMAMTPRLLLNELLSNIACGMIAAWLLAQLPATSFPRRVACVAVLGILNWLSVDFSQWNWYGFPTAFTMAYFVDHAVGFGLMGVVLAWAFKS